MVMVLTVPIEKAAAEAFGILDAAEALREARLILQRVTPRSASSNAVALAFIGPPRSAAG
jgi:hypothetical protein